jgi:hypothetical protein
VNTTPPVFSLTRSLDAESEVRDKFMITTGTRSESVSAQMLASISEQVSWVQVPLVVCEAQRPSFEILAPQLLAACPPLDEYRGLAVKLSFNFLATPFICYRSLSLGAPGFEDDGLQWLEGLDGDIHADRSSGHQLLNGHPGLIIDLENMVCAWFKDHPVSEPNQR